MQITNLTNALINFNNLPQVKELLENCLQAKQKQKIDLNLEIFEEPNIATATDTTNFMVKKVTISLDIEKSQGYSGYRKTYNL